MTPEESNFDDAIRKKISGFAEPPPEELWKRIEEKRKRRFGFWLGFMNGYGFIILCLGLIGSIGSWYFLTDSGLKKESTVQTGVSSPDTTTLTGQEGQALPLAVNQLQTREINPSGNTKKDPENSTGKSNTAGSSFTTQHHSPETKPVAYHSTMKSSAKPAAGENKEVQQIINDETRSSETEPKNGNPDKAADQGNNDHHKETGVDDKAGDKAHEITLSQLLIAEVSPDELLPMRETEAEKIQKENQTAQRSDSTTGPGSTADSIQANLADSKDSTAVTLQEDTVVIKNDTSGRKKFSVELTFSPDFVTKELSANADYEDFIEKRNATESLKNAWSVNLGLNYRITKNIEIGTGLQYSMIHESFHYEYQEETIETNKDTIHGMILFPFGSPQPYTYIVTTHDTIQTTRYASETNSYQFISLPVTLTYTFNQGKFSYGLMAGALVNLSFVQKGKILSADLNSETDLADHSQSPFKDQAGLSIQGGIVGEYHVSNKLDIVIRPVYQYMLNSITQTDYQVKQYYHTFSIRTGIRYNF